MTKVSDCIVEQRSNLGVSEADKKIKRLLKDSKFVGTVPADVLAQLGTVRKSLKDLEKFATVKE